MSVQTMIPPRKKAGRPKGALNHSTREIKALAQSHAGEVIETLMGIVREKDQPGNFRVLAGREILDRGYGKSSQTHKNAVGSYDLSLLTDEQLRTVYDILRPTYIGDTD